jgi:hypothetical protein
MKVRAIELGYYGHKRRQPGAEFVLEPLKRIRKDAKTGLMKEILITPEQQFSSRWMERVDGEAPKKTKEPKETQQEG